uniref:Uncharacterized protein n=1 Tax=Ditylenchus dipsaci TaxID=166011 RepID=A0A915ELP4_9BILA
MYYTPPQQQPQDQDDSQWTNNSHQQQQPMDDGLSKQKSLPLRPASDYAKVFSSGNEPEATASESLQTRRSRLRTGRPAKNLQPINVDNNQQNLKQETMLKLKTDLYLKISEQLQLVLRQAQMSDARARRALMDKVTQLQKNLAEIRNDLLGLHSKVNGQKET